MFRPEVLLARLERRLPVLISRARDVTDRQRTLHATIAWSYELLDADEARDFRALAVFRGGATLDAIEAVTGANADLVESLVDKSLLRRRRDRLVMLETVREFALDELERANESASVRDAHAAYFLELAEGANLNAARLRVAGQRLGLAIADQDNIRSALEWTSETRDLERAFRLLAAMEQFWVVNDPHEGVRRHAAVLDLDGDADLALRAEALRSYASSADIAGEGDLALELYGRSLAIFDELGDTHGRAVLLHRFAIHAMFSGDLERARALAGESQSLHERHNDTWGLAQTVGTFGAIARDEGDLEKASALVAESARLADQVGVAWWHAGMILELAALSLEADKVDDAYEKARAGLELALQLHDYGGRVLGVGLLACVAESAGTQTGPAGCGGRSRTIMCAHRSAAGHATVRAAKHGSSRPAAAPCSTPPSQQGGISRLTKPSPWRSTSRRQACRHQGIVSPGGRRSGMTTDGLRRERFNHHPALSRPLIADHGWSLFVRVCGCTVSPRASIATNSAILRARVSGRFTASMRCRIA